MNLKKYTKAELISKINGLNSKQLDLLNSNSTNSSNNTTFFQVILKTILYFKSLILKIAFIAFIIKLVKKYSILRRLWTIANYSLMSIFGISFVDIYGTEYLNSILNYIRDTQFYTWFSSLLGYNKESIKEIPSRLNTSNKTSTGDQESSRMIERFKQIINNKEEILIEEDTPFYKDKNTYIKGAILLLLLGLGWYYWEDLQPIPGILLEKLNSFRRRPGSDPDNFDNGLQPNTSSTIKEKIKGWWNRGKVDKDEPGTQWTSPSQNNTPVALDSPTRNSLIDQYFPQINKGKLTDPGEISDQEINRRILEQISGDRTIKFDEEASIVLGQLTHFLDKGDNFPDNELKLGMYNTIRAKLLALSTLTPVLYENLIQDNSINNEIERFVKLENKINPVDNQSDTYQEVALATVEEQDVWSDRGSSPKVLSPVHPANIINEVEEDKIEETKTGFAALFDQINKRRKDIVESDDSSDSNSNPYNFTVSNADREQVNTLQTNPGLDLLINLIQEANTFDDSDLLTAVKETFEEEILQDNPKIQINDDSISNNSNHSMDNYFTNPNKSPQDSKLSPILSQINIQTKEFTEGSSKDNFSNLFQEIKSKRKEYGTPIIETKTLFKQDNSSMNNILEDTNNLLDTDLSSPEDSSPQENLPNPWEKVEVSYEKGELFKRFVTLDLDSIKDEVYKILIITTDGRSNYFNPHFNKENIQTIKWDNLGITNPDHKELDIYQIFIIDHKMKNHNIFNNIGANILKSFHDNIGKGNK